MPSSQHQNYDEPSRLLRTLAVVFSGTLFGCKRSDLTVFEKPD